MAQTVRKGAGVSDNRAFEPDRLAALLAAVAGGERTAFAELYQLTSGRLLAIAIRITGERDAAEEVLQEAFLAVWQKAHRYRPDLGSALGWLTTILRHRAIDRVRSIRASRESAVGGDADLDAFSPAASGPSEDRMAAGHSVLRCLERLDAGRRTLILLAFYQGFTHVELSARLALPLGTVKSDIRRGLKDLRTCLDA